MDEDYYNKIMWEERQQMEREAKALTRGCGLLALIVAVLAAVVCIIYSMVKL